MADDTPLLDTVAEMTAASLENCSLEPRELMLARIAALAAVDAPPLSYLVNAGTALDAGVTLDGRPGRSGRDRAHCGHGADRLGGRQRGARPGLRHRGRRGRAGGRTGGRSRLTAPRTCGSAPTGLLSGR